MQLAIVLYPGYTALDFIGPYEVLRMLPDLELRFVAGEVGPVAADSGVLLVGATHTYAETPAPDIVLVPGGPGTTPAMADSELLEWLRRVHDGTTWTTSVCSGSLVLGAAGLLRGHPATTHWMVQSVLPTLGAQARREERIVRSGKLATAAGVSAGIDLALWLSGEIAGREHAELVQLMVEYDPQPPFDTGHPTKASRGMRTRARAVFAKQAQPREVAAVPRVLWQQALARVRARAGGAGARAARDRGASGRPSRQARAPRT